MKIRLDACYDVCPCHIIHRPYDGWNYECLRINEWLLGNGRHTHTHVRERVNIRADLT